MNISVCITVLNEEESVGRLLDSLVDQSKKADEIIVVDGGSADRTIEIINHYQKRFGGIKLLKERCSRAKGRNLGIELARNEIIAITDAGCTADKYWLENLTEPFRNESVGISAGFYKMTGETSLQKAMARFLGTAPEKFDINFLPSARSMAFRKKVWEEIEGFPEEERNSAEDTYFNYSALKLGVKYAHVKSALVEWGMPKTIQEFRFKIQDYARWDARTKIFLFSKKGLASHNIKAFFVLLRYLIALIFFIYCLFVSISLFVYWFICLFAYFVWAYRKAGFWGIILQLVSDAAVMTGFVSGIIA